MRFKAWSFRDEKGEWPGNSMRNKGATHTALVPGMRGRGRKTS